MKKKPPKSIWVLFIDGKPSIANLSNKIKERRALVKFLRLQHSTIKYELVQYFQPPFSSAYSEKGSHSDGSSS